MPKPIAETRSENQRRPTNFEEVLAYFHTWQSPSGAHSQNPDLDAERFFNKQQELDWCWYKGSKKIPAKTWQGLARTYILAVYNPNAVVKKPLPSVEEIREVILRNGWDMDTAEEQAMRFHEWYFSHNILMLDLRQALRGWFMRGFGTTVPVRPLDNSPVHG